MNNQRTWSRSANLHHLPGCMAGHQGLHCPGKETNLTPSSFPHHIILLPPPSSCTTSLVLGV